MIYRLSTFSDICSADIKRAALLRALETRSGYKIDEQNTVCVVKTWGSFSPNYILENIDGEYIGEKTFEDLSFVLETLVQLKEVLKLEWDYRTVNIEYNGLVLLTIVNQAVVTAEESLFLDMNEWCRQLHHAMKPSPWKSPAVTFSAGVLLGIGVTLFLQSRIKY